MQGAIGWCETGFEEDDKIFGVSFEAERDEIRLGWDLTWNKVSKLGGGFTKISPSVENGQADVG